MVAVPLRVAPVFSVQETVTAPEPLPLVGETLIQESSPEADQLPPVQPEGKPVTVTDVEPAAAAGLAEVGEIENDVQVTISAPWFRVNVLPAIVALPLRAAPVFWTQETVTAPEPLPLVGETVIHEPLPEADQLPPEQPDGAPVTVTVVEPAVAPGLADVGEIENDVQVTTPVPWLTVKVLPAIVAPPLRAPPVF